MPRLRQYPEDLPGVPLQDVWTDLRPIHNLAEERLDYPTQKPLSLLERVISVSSNPGDLLLDPFCGCGTAIDAAQTLCRQWIGIDVTSLAIALQKVRLRRFPDVTYEVIGVPTSPQGARQLAHDDRYQFQWWALSLIGARPLGGKVSGGPGKKGADQGIDGVIVFLLGLGATPSRVLVQVKSGHVNSGLVRDLAGTVEREHAAMGVFLTLDTPSQPMLTEAASHGFYKSPWGMHPRIQVLSVEGLLNGSERLDMPPQSQVDRTFKQSRRTQEKEAQTQPLFSGVG
jgi:hypothetical protein